MRIPAISLAMLFCFAAAAPSAALVGQSRDGRIGAAHTVMVLKRASGGSAVCSGVVVADRIVLTAAHCVSGALGVAVHAPTDGEPRLQEAVRVAIHPEFRPDAIRRRQRSIDLALIETGGPLPAHLRPVGLDPGQSISVSDRFIIAGYGLRRENDGDSAGVLREGVIAARAPLSSILLWAQDPAGKGFGACTGDSGGPIFSADGSNLVAITVWSKGNGRRKCGALTQGALVAPQRAWIENTIRRWVRR